MKFNKKTKILLLLAALFVAGSLSNTYEDPKPTPTQNKTIQKHEPKAKDKKNTGQKTTNKKNTSQKATNKKNTSQKNTNQKTTIKQSHLKAQNTTTQAPKYEGKLYTVINANKPYFDTSQATTRTYEHYSPLDRLGRVSVADTILGIETMPTKKRKSIRRIYPSGWNQAAYSCIKAKYLYNRSHLVGFQLAAENANHRNIMTGTRSFNSKGMLPFENKVADYIKKTRRHVRYRVSPYFEGDDLVARGVFIEAQSIEDRGEAISFNVFVHNVQPHITIDYKNGKNKPSNSHCRKID